jgi:hypothetical protein
MNAPVSAKMVAVLMNDRSKNGVTDLLSTWMAAGIQQTEYPYHSHR